MPPVATRCSWLPPPNTSIKCIAFVLPTAYDLISSQVASGSAPVSSQVISERYALPEAASTRLVIVNGTLRPELSDLSGLPQGVYLGSIQGAPAASAAILVRGGSRPGGRGSGHWWVPHTHRQAGRGSRQAGCDAL